MAAIAKLTPRQKLFIRYYLRYRNGSKAARKAGYAPNSASVEAVRLLANASIAESIRAGMRERAARLSVDTDRVLRELARDAFDPCPGKSRSAALKMLGDHLGIFEGKRKPDSPDESTDAERVLSVAQEASRPK